MPVLSIDVYSDVVCPWCFIGERKLELALAQRPQLDVSLRFHPFLLHPYLTPDGEEFERFVVQKFGTNSQRLFTRVLKAAEQVGLGLAPERIRRMPDTTAAHCVISWAAPAQVQGLVRALFRAYFVEGLDVGDPAVLAEVAVGQGLERDTVLERLEAGLDREHVRERAAQAADGGITGVPFFLVNQRWPVPGAQEPETLVRIFDRALEMRS